MTKITTETPVEQSAVDETQAQADFDAGAAMENASGPKTATLTEEQPRDEAGRFTPAKEARPSEKDKPAGNDAPAVPPEYVQLTKQQFEQFVAAAKKTEDFDKQMSKAFGTIGDVQKIVRNLQSQTPRGTAVKIPEGAFAAMQKDFPELAQHMQAALEATLKGMEGTGSASAEVDVEAFDRKIEERVMRLETENLEDAYPDWAAIVGAVDTRKGEKPDPDNAFRKWLATKDKAYQDRVNGTNSAGVITRAIRAFKSETKAVPTAQAQPDPKAKLRADRIQEAVRPKGDGGQPPVKNVDDEFEAGFRTG